LLNYIINKFSSLGIFSFIILYVFIFALILIIISFFIKNKNFKLATLPISFLPLIGGVTGYFYGMKTFHDSVNIGDIKPEDLKTLSISAKEIAFFSIQFSLFFSIPLLLLAFISIYMFFRKKL